VHPVDRMSRVPGQDLTQANRQAMADVDGRDEFGLEGHMGQQPPRYRIGDLSTASAPPP